MNLRIKTWIDKNRYSKLKPAVSISAVKAAEEKLGLNIPAELKVLFAMTNGDGDIFWSLEEMIDANSADHSEGLQDIPSNMLVFAHNGCGDYFGYLIHQADEDKSIYQWDHDLNCVNRVAHTLEDFVERLINEEI